MSTISDSRFSPWQSRPLGMVARATVVVIFLCALAAAVWLGRVIFFAAFFSGLVAAFLSIPVGLLERLKFPRLVATLVATLGLLGIFAGLFALAWPTLSEQFTVIRLRLPDAASEVIEWIQRQLLVMAGEVGDPDPEVIGEVREQLMEQIGAFVSGALPVLNSLFGAVAGAVVAFFAGVYLTVDARRFFTNAVRLVPPASRERVRGALEETGVTLRRWMVGTFINMIVVGTLTGLVLWLLGIPAPFALGLIAGVFEFVPLVGPVLAAIPAIALALIVSPNLVVWVVLALVVVQQIESNVLTPIVMRGVVRIPPALTILFQALMAILFGFLGLFLAVPMLAVLLVLVRRLYVEPMEQAAEGDSKSKTPAPPRPPDE